MFNRLRGTGSSMSTETIRNEIWKHWIRDSDLNYLCDELTQWLLHVSRQAKHEQLIQCQRNVNGVSAIAIESGQKFNCRLELSGQRQHLEVQMRLLVCIEVLFSVFL